MTQNHETRPLGAAGVLGIAFPGRDATPELRPTAPESKLENEPVIQLERQAPTQFKISGVRGFTKNTLRGFFDLEIVGLGLILRGCTLHERDGKSWVGYPGKPFKKDDGTECWANIVDFTDNKSRYLFGDEVLPLALQAFAEAEQ
jgi:hypothetical protein